jgi:acetyltransferase EpsM
VTGKPLGATALVIVGGGEHARVVADAARSQSRFEVLGFVDPNPCEDTVRRGMPRLGGEDALANHAGALLALGVGPKPGSSGRVEIVRRLAGAGRGWATVVHARASVAGDATLDEGAVVMAGAVVQTGARIGRHVVINSGAVIEHDSSIGDFAHVAPGATLGGGVTVGAGAYIGLGASVRDHVAIGRDAVVAMGAVVVADVPDGVEVRGCPARAVGRAR